MTHPLDSSNPDHGCRWLCLTNGTRSLTDEIKLAAVLGDIPKAHPVPHGFFPSAEDIQRRVK